MEGRKQEESNHHETPEVQGGFFSGILFPVIYFHSFEENGKNILVVDGGDDNGNSNKQCLSRTMCKSEVLPKISNVSRSHLLVLFL